MWIYIYSVGMLLITVTYPTGFLSFIRSGRMESVLMFACSSNLLSYSGYLATGGIINDGMMSFYCVCSISSSGRRSFMAGGGELSTLMTADRDYFFCNGSLEISSTTCLPSGESFAPNTTMDGSLLVCGFSTVTMSYLGGWTT